MFYSAAGLHRRPCRKRALPLRLECRTGIVVCSRRVPPLHVAEGEISESSNPRMLVIEAGDEAELPSSSTQERSARLLVDFFKRLQAIGHEARAEHIDTARAGTRKGN